MHIIHLQQLAMPRSVLSTDIDTHVAFPSKEAKEAITELLTLVNTYKEVCGIGWNVVEIKVKLEIPKDIPHHECHDNDWHMAYPILMIDCEEDWLPQEAEEQFKAWK
jgi:hypothetical protein